MPLNEWSGVGTRLPDVLADSLAQGDCYIIGPCIQDRAETVARQLTEARREAAVGAGKVAPIVLEENCLPLVLGKGPRDYLALHALATRVQNVPADVPVSVILGHASWLEPPDVELFAELFRRTEVRIYLIEATPLEAGEYPTRGGRSRMFELLRGRPFVRVWLSSDDVGRPAYWASARLGVSLEEWAAKAEERELRELWDEGAMRVTPPA